MTSGAIGEELVAAQLIKQGWRILARNFRHIGCELDIVAFKKTTLIIVEVKVRDQWCRHMDDYERLMPKRKREALRRGALKFLELKDFEPETIRIDLAVVKKRNAAVGYSIEYFVDIT